MTFWRKKDRIFIALLILSSQTQELTYLGPFDLSDFVVGVYLLIWLLDNFMNPEKKNVLSPIHFFPVVFFILAWIPIMTFGRVSFLSLLFPIKWFLVLFLLVNAVGSRENVFYMIKSYVWMTFLSSVIAVVQFGLFVLTGVILLRKQDHVTMRLRFEETPFGTFFRVSGFFEHIHNFTIVVTIAFLLVFFFHVSRNRRLVSGRTGLLMMTTMLMALIFTFYKGIWLILPSCLLLALFVLWPARSIHLTAGLMAVVLVVYLSGLTDRFFELVSQQVRMGDFQIRLEVDRMGIENRFGNPLLGIGLFNAPIHSPNAFNLPPHNALILIMDELGWLGLAALILLYGYLFIRLMVRAREGMVPEHRLLMKALAVSFVGFLLYVQLEPNAYNFWCWIYFGIIEASLLFLDGRSDNPAVQVSPA